MKSSEASDSSIGGDDSTVSSKSNRNRLFDGENGDDTAGGSSHQVADFSDMPSLASYRGDEVSLASTLWTDCDQSLPSLSSYRTKDMSVVSSTRKNNSQDGKPRNNDDESDGSGTERTRGNMSTSDRLQPPAAPVESIEEAHNPKPSSSASRDEDSTNAAALQRGGDSMPRLPTRRSMDDSVRSGSRRSESDSESDMTDDSPDVSIETDEENDVDEVEPAHGPSHIVIPPTRQLSPQSSKSPLRVNGGFATVEDILFGTTEPATEKEKSKSAEEDGVTPKVPEPPAIIATPPPTGDFSKSPKKAKSPKRSPKKKKDKDKDGTRYQPEIGSPGLVEEKQQKKWRKKRSSQDETSKTPKVPDRSASGNDTTRFLGKKNQSDKSLGVRRANSEMASVLDSIKPPEEEKKRGILKRFSSSLKQMVRPSRTLSGTFGNMSKTPAGGKKRSKLKKLSAKVDRPKAANA